MKTTSVTHIECLNIFSTGVSQDSIITFAFNVAGIHEGNESFIHRLIRLMCGTHDDLEKSPQSTVNNSYTVYQLS